MKQKTINLYEFSELSDEAKEKAINDYRESNWEDKQFAYEELKSELEDANSYFSSFSEDWMQEEGCIFLYEVAKVKCIESIKIGKLDTYHGICRIDLSLNSDVFLEFIVNNPCYLSKSLDDFSKLLKYCHKKDIIWDNGYGLDFHSANNSRLGTIFMALSDELIELEKSLKEDIEHYILKLLREEEESLNSEEAISERLKESDCFFLENGEIEY